MPRQRVVRVYVQPYVRKFLLTILGDPVHLALDVGAQDLLRTINKEIAGTKRLARRLAGVVNDRRPGEKNRGYIDLWMYATEGGRVKLSRWQHRDLVSILSRQYFTQLFQVLEWCRGNHGAARNQRAAIQLWLEKFGIDEEEHALHSIERLARKHKGEGVDPFLLPPAPERNIRRRQRQVQLALFGDIQQQ